ncbi:MAG: hypothetical protein HFE76_17180, partial [Firmicutes bacterium]|nr:hypothetical protein [Bacillota bacterium]
MKKKLIAIVASLAMVATMVPASAFAAEGDPAPEPTKQVADLSQISVKPAIDDQIDKATEGGADYGWWTQYKNPANTATGETINQNVKGDYANNTLTLSGTVPYTANFTQFSSVADMQKGNYIALACRAVKPPESNVAGWAISYSSEGYGTETKHLLYTYTYAADADAACAKVGSDFDLLLWRVAASKPDITLTISYLSPEGVTAFKAKKLFASNEKSKLDALLTNKAYVAGSKTVTVKTNGLTLLTEAQTNAAKGDTDAVAGFVNDVAAIGVAAGVAAEGELAAKLDGITKDNPVGIDYRKATVSARATYGSLTAAQKKVVDDAVAATEASNEKTAYEKLLIAEKNVASYDTLPTVAAQVAALPMADRVDLKDEAAVKQVKDVIKVVEALTPGVKKTLLATSGNAYLNPSEVANYQTLAGRVNNAEAQIVIDAINALPTLPTAFTDKESVDKVHEPLDAVNKDYEALTDDQKTIVDNSRGTVYTTYKNNYTARLKAYVDGVYAKAAKIDLEAELSEDSVALIKELQAYVEKRYIEKPTDATEGIKDFEWDVYDALIAALDGSSSLEKATIAEIADQTYTGEKLTPAVTVTIGSKEVAADAYTVIYNDNRDAGTATVTVVAKAGSGYTGTKEATFTIKPAALTADMVKVANATYTGKALKPAVSVASGVDYTVAYKNNTAVGKASAVVTGTGNYTGTITKNFIVKPAKESITSLKAGTKQITVAYKAQTGAKYRVICKASGLKAIGTNTTATKKTVKKLKSGKTYQVKVRAYKAVDGKTYYGTYSA